MDRNEQETERVIFSRSRFLIGVKTATDGCSDSVEAEFKSTRSDVAEKISENEMQREEVRHMALVGG